MKKLRYVQRDLEDQINEEIQSKNFNNVNFDTHLETNLNNKSMSTVSAPKKSISISEVLSLLDKGYTRLEKFNRGEGSVQAHYSLTNSQVKELFENPKLKGRKTKGVSVNVIDDAPNVVPLTITPKTPKAAKTTATVSAPKTAAATDSQLFS